MSNRYKAVVICTLFLIGVVFNSVALSAENTADAKKFMARGQAAVEMAKDDAGFLRAAKEFEQAIAADPGLAEAYYNLGIVLDKAGQYDRAIENLNIYLEKAPNASDAEDVQGLIFKIEYRKEETDRQVVEEVHKASEEAEMNLEGVWIGAWQPSDWGIFYRITKVGDEFQMAAYRNGKLLQYANKFYLTVDGNNISGRTSEDWTCYGNGRRSEYDVSGYIDSSGDKFTLNYQGVEPTSVTAGAVDMADGWRRRNHRQTYIQQD